MAGKYPKTELKKILPTEWMTNWEGEIIEEEGEENEINVNLGNKKILTPTGRVQPLFKLKIIDMEKNKYALDEIDSEMRPLPMEDQMPYKTERSIYEKDGKKVFLIARPDYADLTMKKKKVKILYAHDRFLVILEGSSEYLDISIAGQIIEKLDFEAELKMPEGEASFKSKRDFSAIENVMQKAYEPFANEAEAFEKEMEDLIKAKNEGKISNEEFLKKQNELQLKAMQFSQKFMSFQMGNFGMQSAFNQQLKTEKFCKSCGASIGDVKFCPQCGAANEVKKNCQNCNAELSNNPKFCPNCGTPV